jgi:transportin-1
MLSKARTSPDFVYYLTYIFSTPQVAQLGFSGPSLFTIRYSAAINLKNHIKLSYRSIPKQALSYIKSSVVQALQDVNPQLRGFAGTVITEIVQQGGLLGWPQILTDLLSLINDDSQNVPAEAQEGAMSALAKLCEDNKKLLNKEVQGQQPLNVLIPMLLRFTDHSDSRIRRFALQTLNIFISQKPKALISRLDSYLARLFQLANDPSAEVRRIVCQSLVQLADTRPDLLAPHVEGLVDYILAQQQNQDDPDLALDAAGFWLNIGELKQSMGPYLSRVIPVLLQGMIYSEEDVERLAGENDDADEEDKVEDVKPQFAQAKSGRAVAGSTNDNDQEAARGINGHSHVSEGAIMDSGSLSEGEIEDDDDYGCEEGDPEEEWNLRKCSAAALDVFAVVFQQPVFEIILPYLKENLSHTLWPRREAAVLSLGAIAEGCMKVVSPHLPELIPFLISLLADPEPVVRQITCWCLGRYSEWGSHLQDPIDRSRYFEPMMEGLLKRMLDKSKRVQEAAASAFASLEEKSGDRLKPYTEPILRQFVQCFGKYKDKNMYILYDCVQTLADAAGSEIAKPHLVELLMPVLIGRWNRTSDQSMEMFPLLGCLGYVAAAYGDAFSPFAPTVFARCNKIIYQNLQDYMAVVSGQAVDEPDKDFIVTSLDLLSSIIQAIDSTKSCGLVASSQPQLFDLLAFCMEDPTNDVKQSAFALLGDCAINIYPQLEPQLPKVMPLLIRQLDLDLIQDANSETGFNVLNNACWACGEIGVRAGPNITPYIEAIYQGLITIISHEDIPDSVNENASMSLGRLGLASAEQLAPHLPEFAEPFLRSMANIVPTQEKASAFLGFSRVVERNPRAMENSLGEFFTAIAAFPKKEASVLGLSRVTERNPRAMENSLGEFFTAIAAIPEEDASILGFREVRQSFGNVSDTLQPTDQNSLKRSER